MGKVKALFGMVVVAAVFYFCWNLVPVWFTNYQFQDDLDDIARVNSYRNRSEDEIKQIVVAKAKSRDLDVKEQDVIVTKSQEGVGITVHYHVHLDLLVKPYDSDVTAQSLNKRI
jgi:hypothetical protein